MSARLPLDVGMGVRLRAEIKKLVERRGRDEDPAAEPDDGDVAVLDGAVGGPAAHAEQLCGLGGGEGGGAVSVGHGGFSRRGSYRGSPLPTTGV